jgi:UDP-N-acetylglucosamine--N-acetylmuramyl-(pentapeptide) pyrophosphoryl-undecaprenol N-acetylglucosamine transferase
LPSILIPFRAAGAHQSHNAAAWQRAGCCRTIRPQDLSGSTLAHAILALAADRAALDDMARAARAQHRPDAAERLAALCVHSIHP